MSQAVARVPSQNLSVATRGGIVVPRVIADAGDQAARRFLEFFAATIRNKNTRMAYYRAVWNFFAWCELHEVGEIADIEPLHVAAYIEVLQQTMAKPSVKQHLAAVRMLFDWLVTGQVVATNPAHSVRGPKHVVRRGKTSVLTADQARELLDSIDTSTVVGRWCTRQTKGETALNPSCYAITAWRRTESGRPVTNIRFNTATPTAASVCWALKPPARNRGPTSVL